MNFLRYSLLAVFLTSTALWGDAFKDSKKALDELDDASKQLDVVLDELRTKQLPQMKTIHQCFLSAEHLADLYLKIKRQRLGVVESDLKPAIYAEELEEKSYDLNIINNIKALEASQKQLETNLLKLVDDFSADGKSKDDVSGLLKRLDGGGLELSDVLITNSRRESMMLHIIDDALEQLNLFQNRNQNHLNYLQSETCEPSKVSGLLASFQDDLSRSVEDVAKFKQYVLDLRPKRNRLVERTIKSLRDNLKTRYYNLTFEDLESIQSQLIDIVRLDKLGGDMIKWWQGENLNGLADNKHLKYLQYEAPLFSLRLIDSKAASFERQIKAFVSVPESSRQHYLDRLDSFKKTITRNLSRLEKNGWKGQLERQILIGNRRLDRSDLYDSSCITAVDRHLKKANAVEDIYSFREVEPLYAATIAACSR